MVISPTFFDSKLVAASADVVRKMPPSHATHISLAASLRTTTPCTSGCTPLPMSVPVYVYVKPAPEPELVTAPRKILASPDAPLEYAPMKIRVTSFGSTAMAAPYSPPSTVTVLVTNLHVPLLRSRR